MIYAPSTNDRAADRAKLEVASFQRHWLVLSRGKVQAEELPLRQTQSAVRSAFMQDTVTGAFFGANPKRHSTS